jgi:predicted acylesterase/phospholipase RssA
VTRGENRAAAFLRSYDSGIDTLRHCTIWEAARATSAAPLFFAPIKIGDLGSIYADGGITNNNPVFAMHTQVNKDPVFGIANHPRPKSIIACIVSIGTGKMETKGLGSDLKAVIEACVDMATDTENKAKLFADEHQDMVQSKRYFRFNVEQGMQGIGLEEGKKLNLMEAATDEYLDGITGQLRDCAALLSNPTPPPYSM